MSQRPSQKTQKKMIPCMAQNIETRVSHAFNKGVFQNQMFPEIFLSQNSTTKFP